MSGPTLAFAPCPSPKTFAFLEHMAAGERALVAARTEFKAAAYPDDGEEWSFPSDAVAGVDLALGRVRQLPTCGAGVFVWGACLGEEVDLDGRVEKT